MSQLLALLMVLSDLGSETHRRRSTYQVGTAIGLMSLSLICAAGAIGCTAAAIWFFSAEAIGPAGAALVTAGALLIPCAIVLIACRPEPLGRARVAPAGSELELVNLVAGEAKQLVREHKVPVLLAAFLAGLAASNGQSRG